MLLSLGQKLFSPCYSWCNQVLWSPQMVQKIPPGGGTSNWRWDLQLEVRSPIGGDTSDQRWHLWLEAPMLHVGISYSFEKKRDYLLLITSSCPLSTRGNVNLFIVVIVVHDVIMEPCGCQGITIALMLWPVIWVWVLVTWPKPHPIYVQAGTCQYFCLGMGHWLLLVLPLWWP